MEANLKIEIEDFPVPVNVVRKSKPQARQEGFELSSKIVLLSELSSETLEELCRNFRNSVFETAGIKKPVIRGDIIE